MAEFKPAFEYVLAAEGGFVDKPNDPGGATNMGISLRFLREVPGGRLKKYGFFSIPDVESIRNLTREQASLVYEGEFWNFTRFDEIKDQKICNYIFSMAVLHGVPMAIRIAQRAFWAFVGVYGCIHDDGILGNIMLEELNDSVGAGEYRAALMAEHAGVCRKKVAINPRLSEFLHGWLNRCYQW